MPTEEPWGKRERNKGEGAATLPLADHCVDVACVLEALLGQRTLRRRLARLAGLAELDDVLIARLCVIAGLHDLGKANHGFQGKWRPGSQPIGHVGEALWLLRCDSADATLFKRLLDAIRITELSQWFEGDFLSDLLDASICHHGGPSEPVLRNSDIWQKRPELDPLAEIARITDRMFAAFPNAADKRTPPTLSRPFVHAYGGLMMLADWIGSDERRFVYAPPTGEERIAFARAEAARSVERIGLSGETLRRALAVPADLSSVLPEGGHGRPAQEVIERLPLPEDPSLVVLESETGSGKTEAALLWFLRLLSAGEVDGIYFALPTRAASIQIWQRVEALAKRWFGEATPPVVRAVPGYIRREERDPGSLAPTSLLWPDAPPPRLWAEENPKRFLAGGIVIGTIDQVLLSALDVRHSRMRAAALLRHLLVVDEVHASDPYMSSLLQAVVNRQREAGGHVLLLSATLGASLRTMLTGEPLPTLSVASSDVYPLVTVHTAKTVVHPVKPGASRVVAVRRGPSPDDAEHIASLAIDAARRGARVLVIRNTVSTALDVQRVLELRGSDVAFRVGEIAAPHHSRFSPVDRATLDRAVEAKFGKNKANSSLVLVATQTCEQSLDIDADLLITDLCPADVLLQRIGRLHRHNRQRPEDFRAARCLVLLPDNGVLERAAAPDAWNRKSGFARGPHGYGPVYGDLRVLEITRRLVASEPDWEIPRDCRALVEATTHPEALNKLAEEPGSPWREHGSRVFARASAQRSEAYYRLAHWDRPYEDAGRPGQEEELALRTRLGADGLQVELEGRPVGPFGDRVDLLPVPRWWVPGEGDPAVSVEGGMPLRFTVGGISLLYSAHGVSKVS